MGLLDRISKLSENVRKTDKATSEQTKKEVKKIIRKSVSPKEKESK